MTKKFTLVESNPVLELKKIFAENDQRLRVGVSWSKAISKDGKVSCVGGCFEEEHSPCCRNNSLVFVLTWDGSTWVKQAELRPTDWKPGSWFGCSVSLSDNGDVICVGGEGVYNGPGAVYIFRKEGNGWIQEAKIINPEPPKSTWFGWSVKLSDDGNTVSVGGLPDDDGDDSFKADYVFARSQKENWLIQPIS